MISLVKASGADGGAGEKQGHEAPRKADVGRRRAAAIACVNKWDIRAIGAQFHPPLALRKMDALVKKGRGLTGRCPCSAR